MPKPRGSPKVKRRRPGSQPKALRRSRRWLAGWRAGRTGRGELRADGAGLGRAPPPPKDLGTWIASDRAVSALKQNRNGGKKDIKKDRKELKLNPGTWKPHPLLPSSP